MTYANMYLFKENANLVLPVTFDMSIWIFRNKIELDEILPYYQITYRNLVLLQHVDQNKADIVAKWWKRVKMCK